MAQGLLGGVLPAIYSGADQLKRGVYGLLTNPMEQAERAGQSLLQSRADRQALMARTFANPDRPFQVTDQAGLAQLGDQVMSGELGFAPAGITAFHGSPYAFNKFDMSKVGSGEGNQAFGHGMYFAEAPDVARSYMPVFEEKQIQNEIFSAGGDINKAIQNATLESMSLAGRKDVPLSTKQEVFDLIDGLKKIKQGEPLTKGSLYKVDIPDEYVPKMLDYDKPLSQQPKDVLDSLKKLNDPYINEALTTKPKPSDDGEYWTYMGNTYATKSEALEDVTGQRLISGYTNIAKNPQELSSVLNSVGIKGVKYLDQDSRMIDKGTSNFVVFDPTDVKILERNSQPVEGLLGN
jgi:hypothetical protein